jgi:Tol biopolymer transport system component
MISALLLRLTLLIVVVFVAACQPAQPSPADGPKPVPTVGALQLPGRLIYPEGNKLVELQIASRAKRPLAEFPRNAIVANPVVSPDGTQFAFTVYIPSAGASGSKGADLYLIETSDGTPRLFLAADGPGVSLGQPAWSADGRTIYFTRWAARYEGERFVGQDERIERVERDGTGRRVVVPDASSVTLSGDGQHLAYLASTGADDQKALWLATADGQNPRQLVGPEFTQIDSPRFAPNDGRLVIAAVGGPADDLPVRPRASLWRPGLPGGATVAQAHGIPWDIWLVSPDGSKLTRLTDVSEDSPMPTWSPDGAWIAFSGEAGLYLVDIAKRQTVKLSEDFVPGVAWLTP